MLRLRPPSFSADLLVYTLTPPKLRRQENIIETENVVKIKIINDPVDIKAYIRQKQHKEISEEEHLRRVERLKEYQYIKCDLEFYREELERTIEYKTTLTHVMDGLPSGNLRKQPEDKWLKLMEYEDEIIEYLAKQIQRQLKELKKFERVINNLPARERSVIRGRYIANKQFKEIAKMLPLSDRMIYHAHKNGVAELDADLFD